LEKNKISEVEAQIPANSKLIKKVKMENSELRTIIINSVCNKIHEDIVK